MLGWMVKRSGEKLELEIIPTNKLLLWQQSNCTGEIYIVQRFFNFNKKGLLDGLHVMWGCPLCFCFFLYMLLDNWF